LRLFHQGAREARDRTGRRRAMRALALLASSLALVGMLAVPSTASATTHRVVIVVGPVGSSTANYIDNARIYANYARSLGASVTEIYSPNATWARVKAALQGANMLIYLGHGNGWPSAYYPFNPYTKDGLGLNRTSGAGNSNVKYYGEYYLATGVRMAANAVVLFNRLCYASGNNEWGAGYPSRTTARARVGNFGYGFLHAGARAVFANATSSLKPIIHDLFRTNRTMAQIFRADPAYVGTYRYTFQSGRTSWATAILDPSARNHYYHSVIGSLGMTAATWR
jgi:hypothetical protein